MGYVTLSVTPGAYYFINGDVNSITQYGAYFDSQGVYISSIQLANTFILKNNKTKYSFAIPAGVTTVKLNFALTQINNMIIFQDASKLHGGTTVEDKWIKNNVIKKSSTPFISNIMDNISSAAVLDYGYIRMDGAITLSSTFWGTAPIPVKPGEIYKVENWLSATYLPSSISTKVVYLDSNFVFAGQTSVGSSYSPEYTIPSGVSYAAFLFEASLINSFSIKRTYSPTEDIYIRRESIYPPLPIDIVDGWNGKKWTSFGDSITYRELWQPYVISAFTLIHTNCGIGSTLLAGTSTSAFWQAVRLDTVKASNPDVVTILGGANDLVYDIPIGDNSQFGLTPASKDKNTFKGAYSYIIENLLTWKPTLRIVLLTTTYAHMDGDSLAHTSGLKYTDYANATKEVALYYGLPCVDLNGESGCNKITQSTYTSDNIHPNDAGGKKIAELVIGKLKSINPL